MKRNLNWKIDQIVKDRHLIPIKLVVTLSVMLLLNTTNAQNIGVLRTSEANDHDNPFLYIGYDDIGDDVPCNAKFAISVEAESNYIFCAESAFNATLGLNDSIIIPENSRIEGENNRMTRTKSFDRIKNLNVGFVNSGSDKKWSLDSKQFKNDSMYAQYVFDIKHEGEDKVAFSFDPIFYEMLISVQELAKQNEIQTAKIESQVDQINLLIENNQLLVNKIDELEAAFNLRSENKPGKTSIGNININPNPNNKGILYVDYSVIAKSGNPTILITDIRGKAVYEESLMPQLNGKLQINLKLPAGVYFYQLVNSNEQTTAKKLIIQ